MEWSSRYQPPQPALWTGRDDGPDAKRYHQIIQPIDLRTQIPKPPQKPAFALLGFACDEGIRRNQGRPGASEGPQSLRKSLSNLPAPPLLLYDFGDITCTDGDLEASQSALSILTAMLLAQQITPIILGGGHEVAWGTYKGILTFNPNIDCAIVNFDAHYDLRPLTNNQGNSGTSFLQISDHLKSHNRPFPYYPIGIQKLTNTAALHTQARDLDITPIFSDEIASAPSHLKKIQSLHPHIYLTICLDVFAAPFAPGVSSPQPLGLLPHDLLPLLTQLSTTQILALDIAELSPSHDPFNTTSRLASLLIHNFLATLSQSVIS